MRKDLLAAALGFLVGAAALAGGEEDDWELTKRLQDLQEAIARLQRDERPVADRLPPMGPQGLELELFPVFDLTSGRRDYLVPELVRESEQYFGGWGEAAAQPYGTVEEMMELVRSCVWPASYEEGAVLHAQGQTLIGVNKRAALLDTERFLDRLRVHAHRCVTLELEAVDILAPQLHRRLVAGGTTTLSAEQVDALAQALADGSAKRAFGARTTCFMGQRAVVWHGRQVAVLNEPDVTVAQDKSADEPEVGVVNDGGWLGVRPNLADGPAWITLDVDARFDELGPRVARETGAGRLDLPAARRVECRTALTVENRAWALLGGGTRAGEAARVLLLRATHLPRTGGAR
ncbi:MAG: hypothetical protein ACYTG3_03060 [Planctomycetota bacterium]|jgi:hypothetical protein